MNLMSHTVVIVLKDFQISKRCNFPTCFLLFFSISSRHCSTTGTSWLLKPLLINNAQITSEMLYTTVTVNGKRMLPVFYCHR